MRFLDQAQVNCCAMSLKFHVDHWLFLGSEPGSESSFGTETTRTATYVPLG